MLFTQQFEDTPPMDDFLDPSFLERDDEALLMTPPRSYFSFVLIHQLW